MSGADDDPLKFDDLDLPGPSDEGQSEMPDDLAGLPSPEAPTADFPSETTPESPAEPGAPVVVSDDTASSAAETEERPAKKKKKKKKKSRGPGLFARLRQTSPYVVLLGISVLAILLAVGILFFELWQYQFEFRPQI